MLLRLQQSADNAVRTIGLRMQNWYESSSIREYFRAATVHGLAYLVDGPFVKIMVWALAIAICHEHHIRDNY